MPKTTLQPLPAERKKHTTEQRKMTKKKIGVPYLPASLPLANFRLSSYLSLSMDLAAHAPEERDDGRDEAEA
jgi:hypothetical protein